ncbi:hypothetical protein AOLI_G00194520 [Acnodon oligacanthus]
MVWQRLEEFYGSAEAMETALFNKLERFPKIYSKDSQRLRELGDLLLELDSAKAEGCLPGLCYLDAACGIHPILEKLPFSIQEKWMVQGTRYKQEHHVSFPPFSFFSSFIHAEAKMRNDHSFQLTSGNTALLKTERFQRGTVRNPIMVHKTELDSVKNDVRGATKRFEDPNRNCPLHKKPHPLPTLLTQKIGAHPQGEFDKDLYASLSFIQHFLASLEERVSSNPTMQKEVERQQPKPPEGRCGDAKGWSGP